MQHVELTDEERHVIAFVFHMVRAQLCVPSCSMCG